MEAEIFQHWQVAQDDLGIVWLTFDKKDSSTNTIDYDVLDELLAILKLLEQLQEKNNHIQNTELNKSLHKKPLGIVIQSGKKNGFIAGADVHLFDDFKDLEEIQNFIEKGQQVFKYLANYSLPTMALIQGFCLGGGLEMSLACRYRIAVIDPKTKLGFPEVLLGIQPGWGGSVRLIRLIGPIKAMDLLLSGKTINAKTAYKMGIVDAAVPIRTKQEAVHYFFQKQPHPRQITRLEALPELPWLRKPLGSWLRKQVAKKAKETHYPAPYTMIDNWVEFGSEVEGAFDIEVKSVLKLAATDTARQLVRVFALREKLKSLCKGKSSTIQRIHVVGAGVMGGDIAAWCALKGFIVTLQDQKDLVVATALKRALDLFKKVLKEPYLIKAAQDRLIPDLAGDGIKKADLILEAIVEKKEAKQELFKELLKHAPDTAVFATNTSTIPLNEIAESHKELKKRLLGLHFFNPVSRMPLIEVVTSTETDPQVLERALAFVSGIDKLPLLVKSSPGFLVNRVLMPYIMESMRLVEEGVPAVAIDQAAEAFGMPMGPIELADTVGLDVCLYAAESLGRYFESMGAVPVECKRLVEQGHLGKKTSQGFYRYKNGKIQKEKLPNHYQVPADLSDRIILRMLNEAVACLREKVVQDQDSIDAGMIFGTGFPPFRGGPFAYIASQGEALLLQRLNLLSQRYGNRFLPDVGWNTLEQKNM